MVCFRFAKFLLQIHDNEINSTIYCEDKPRIFVMLQSGAYDEPFQLIEFTEFIIQMVRKLTFFLKQNEAYNVITSITWLVLCVYYLYISSGAVAISMEIAQS